MRKEKKWGRRLLAGAAVAGAAVGAYALFVERFWIQVTRPRIHVAGLHPALEGLRIALLTDLHAGGATPLSLVRRAVKLAMRERPDIVALTGDFALDDVESFHPVFQAVAGLRAPLGVYAVPGNHDHVAGIDRWREALQTQTEIVELTNTYVMCGRGGARLCIAGVDDFYEGDPRLSVPDAAERDFTLLLAHGPDQAERLRRGIDRVDLVLSGHTHGGQVKVPGFGAAVNPAYREDLYVEGLRRRPWTQVYISRGVGTVHIPMRFMSRPEVAILHLTAAPREAYQLR